MPEAQLRHLPSRQGLGSQPQSNRQPREWEYLRLGSLHKRTLAEISSGEALGRLTREVSAGLAECFERARCALLRLPL